MTNRKSDEATSSVGGLFRLAATFVLLFLLFAVATTAQSANLSQKPTVSQENQTKRDTLNPKDIPDLKAKAETGDLAAQAKLGQAYRDGNGVRRNDAEAAKWLRKAADQGDPESANSLGVLYSLGEGVERNKEEAFRWYRRAAKEGDAKAMFNLGASYYNGDGVEIDDTASFAWFFLAKEAGHPAAEDALRRATSENRASLAEVSLKIAKMYEAGTELTRNPDRALKWYRYAGDLGDPLAQVTVARMLTAKPTPTPEEYVEVRQRCEKAARNYPPGAYCMVQIYRYGVGVPKDATETMKWLKRAGDMGNAQAVLDLGEAYWKGDGIPADPVNAYMYIWLAYKSNVPGAEHEEQELRTSLSAKQVADAQQKGKTWALQHRSLSPGLRYRVPESSPPAAK